MAVAYTLSEFLCTFGFGYRKDDDKYFVFDWEDRQLVENRATADGSFSSILEIVTEFSDYFYEQVYDYLDETYNDVPEDYDPDNPAELLHILQKYSEGRHDIAYSQVLEAILDPDIVIDDFGTHTVPEDIDYDDYDEDDYDEE